MDPNATNPTAPATPGDTGMGQPVGGVQTPPMTPAEPTMPTPPATPAEPAMPTPEPQAPATPAGEPGATEPAGTPGANTPPAMPAA